MLADSQYDGVFERLADQVGLLLLQRVIGGSRCGQLVLSLLVCRVELEVAYRCDALGSGELGHAGDVLDLVDIDHELSVPGDAVRAVRSPRLPVSGWFVSDLDVADHHLAVEGGELARSKIIRTSTSRPR
jgi:hypothetical protein